MPAKSLLTPEQWQAARVEWETDPARPSFATVAMQYGVSGKAIEKRAKKPADRWVRRENMASIAQQAQLLADQVGHARDNDGSKVPTRSKAKPAADGPNVEPSKKDRDKAIAEATGKSIDVRAAVLIRHREELERLESHLLDCEESWRLARAKFAELRSGGPEPGELGAEPGKPLPAAFESEMKAWRESVKHAREDVMLAEVTWKTAKLAVTTRAAKQDAERKAYGLDAYLEPVKPGTGATVVLPNYLEGRKVAERTARTFGQTLGRGDLPDEPERAPGAPVRPDDED